MEQESDVQERYLEIIYNMAMEGDIVIGARLAEKLCVAPPTVTAMLKRLARKDLIQMDARRQIGLTARGEEMAEAILRRHRLTERFLMDMLGMQWHEVHEDALHLEHRISGAVEQRVIAALGYPTTCPHGNPIPGCVPNAGSYLRDAGAVRLLHLRPGQSATLMCVSEVVEDEGEIILYLHDRGLMPGTRVTLRPEPPSAEDERLVWLDGADAPVRIAARVAYALWAVPETSPVGSP